MLNTSEKKDKNKNPKPRKTVLVLDGDLCLPCLSLQLMFVGDKSRILCVPVVTIFLKN